MHAYSSRASAACPSEGGDTEEGAGQTQCSRCSIGQVSHCCHSRVQLLLGARVVHTSHSSAFGMPRLRGEHTQRARRWLHHFMLLYCCLHLCRWVAQHRRMPRSCKMRSLKTLRRSGSAVIEHLKDNGRSAHLRQCANKAESQLQTMHSCIYAGSPCSLYHHTILHSDSTAVLGFFGVHANRPSDSEEQCGAPTASRAAFSCPACSR